MRLCELLSVTTIWLTACFWSSWVNAQTTEHTRLYGTFNVNRQPYNAAYDDPRNRYSSSSSSSGAYGSSINNASASAAANKDTIYWERTREQLRNQQAIANTDRYSPNWGSNDRVSETRYDSRGNSDPSRAQGYDPNRQSQSTASGYGNNNPSYGRYPSSDSRGYIDGRNQNYDSKALFDSKVPSFQTGGGSAPALSSGSSSSLDQDSRGSQSNWELSHVMPAGVGPCKTQRALYVIPTPP